jgi:hypothetical protein
MTRKARRTVARTWYGLPMSAARAFLTGALCLALAATALAEPSGRKGTRNYRPDGATATDTPDTQTSTIPRDEKLQQCMETWDPGTHITKAKWREICIRQLDAR